MHFRADSIKVKKAQTKQDILKKTRHLINTSACFLTAMPVLQLCVLLPACASYLPVSRIELLTPSQYYNDLPHQVVASGLQIRT